MSRQGGVLGDRFLEILAVVLLGIATVGTAWCGLQSTLWNGEQADRSMAASSQRVEANRQFGLATQTISYDSGLVSDYAQAVVSGNDRLQQFYREVLMREDFLPYLDRWQAQIQAGEEPPNILEDPEYLAGIMGPYQEALSEAEAGAVKADEAGQVGDSYVLTTVLLAISLFFAGVTPSFRHRTARLALLTGSVLAIAVAASRLIDLPVAESTGQLFPGI